MAARFKCHITPGWLLTQEVNHFRKINIMPSLANITIKKADGTTDVVYTAVAGAAGDNNAAIFRNNTVGTTLAERPTLLVKSTNNANKTARRIRVDFSWPLVTTDSGGNKTVIGRATGDCSFLAPQNQDASVIKEQAYQFGNLIASAMVKASFEEGYAPRS